MGKFASGRTLSPVYENHPKFNLSQHASALDGFSCQNRFLSSSFLYSLPTQKPSSEGAPGAARSVTCATVNPQRLQNPQIRKAWYSLCTLKVACRNDLNPRITSPVVCISGADNSPSTAIYSCYSTPKKTTVWSSFDTSRKSSESSIPEEMLNHHNFVDSNSTVGKPVVSTSTSLPERSNAAETFRDSNMEMPYGRDEAVIYPDLVSNGFIDHGLGESFADVFDDDEFFQNLDVDQIIHKQFRSTCTQQLSMPELPSFSPAVQIDNCRNAEGTCLPPELSANWVHGLKVALCPETATHLQEMKELLISISNEVLDNVDDLRSSPQLKKLSQDRSDVLLRQLENLHSCQSLSRIVVDEAHFVSQWGHDFRPDYQSLGVLKQKFPNTPVLALTATTTASVKEDVVQALGLVFCIVFTQSFNRPNLWYSTVPRQITVWRTSTNSLETTILMNVAIYIVFPEWTVRKFWRSCRFSAPMKTTKPLVAKDPLAASSGKTNNPQENEADKSLSAKIFDALMLLRSGILDTAAEGVNVHHIHLCST